MGFFDIISAPFKFVGHLVEEVISVPKSIVHDVTSIPKAIVHEVGSGVATLVHEGGSVIRSGQDMVKSVAGSADHAIVGGLHEASEGVQGFAKSLSMPLMIAGGAALLFMVTQKK